MRIDKLRLVGFGPYKHEQVVDFGHFADDGIFLIAGKTGAGKSSLLDAICFALYDGVPRYEGTKPRLRSDHCGPDDATVVELEFTIHGSRYKVTRSPEYERLRKRGGGTTTQAATASLERLDDGVWVGLAAKPRDVGLMLSELIGLSREQFLQVILLAQNRFQEFLLAKSNDRLALLRTLFGTRRFAELEAALQERRTTAKAALGDAEARVRHRRGEAASLLERAGWPGTTSETAAAGDTAEGERGDAGAQDAETTWFQAGLRWLETEAADAEKSLAAHSIRVKEVERERDAAHALAEQQRRRDAATRALAELEQSAGQTAELRAMVERAERAAMAWPQLAAHERALDAQAATTADLNAARSEFSQLTGTLHAAIDNTEAAALADAVATGDEDAIDQLIETLIGIRGRLDAALADERRLPELERAFDTAKSDRERLEGELDERAEQAKRLPTRIAELDRELHEQRVLAATLEPAVAELRRLEAAGAVANELERLRPRLERAISGELDASRQHAEAAQRLATLRESRYRGYAAELASQLEDGSPCGVCGSTEHPQPATPGADVVTQTDIDDATVHLDAARDALDSAAAEVQRLREALVAATARLGDDYDELSDPATLTSSITEALTVAEERTKVARDAADAVEHTSAAIEQLTRELAEAQERVAEAGEQRTTAIAAEQAARRGRDDLTTALQRHRAGFAAIADRAHALTSSIAAAKRLRDALVTAAERRTALELAAAELGQALDEHQFTSADDVRSARLAPAVLEQAREGIRAYEAELSHQRATLEDPQLQRLPDEHVDTAAVDAALIERQAARDAAVSVHSARSEQLVQLRRITDDAMSSLEEGRDARIHYEAVLALANTVKGEEPNTRRMSLEAYVLAAELEAIVDAANSRLRTMTDARYTLVHDDDVQYRRAGSGLGLAILDQHTGLTRATHSLSGGETFLASLALALGLAEVVTSRAGGITLDTLFIDEGFGSLDPATLETAMSTLHGLRAGGRTIGLISHVEAMREQIPATLRIAVEPQGWSLIEQLDSQPATQQPMEATVDAHDRAGVDSRRASQTKAA